MLHCSFNMWTVFHSKLLIATLLHFYTNGRMILCKVSCKWVVERDAANRKNGLFPDYYFFYFLSKKNTFYFLQQCYNFPAVRWGEKVFSHYTAWNLDVFIAVMTFSFENELCRMLTWHLTSPRRVLASAKNATRLYVAPCAEVSPQEIIVLSIPTRAAALFGEQEVLIWECNECNSF